MIITTEVQEHFLKKTTKNYLDCTIVKIGQNTEKSWGDLLSPKLKRNTSANPDGEKTLKRN